MAVTNLLYLLRPSVHDPEAQRYLDDAEQELGRVSRITSQSLKFHRQSTVPQWEKLSSLLDSAVSLFKARINLEHTAIVKDYQDQSLVFSYASELRQVFGNLLGNALDALGRQGGTVYLRTRESRDSKSGEPGIRLTLADTGQGMDASTIGIGLLLTSNRAPVARPQ